jgi:hypothetical protein
MLRATALLPHTRYTDSEWRAFTQLSAHQVGGRVGGGRRREGGLLVGGGWGGRVGGLLVGGGWGGRVGGRWAGAGAVQHPA